MKGEQDPPNTCHMVGCPGKGVHPPHGIGTGKWEDYQVPKYCLGFPVVSATTVGSLLAVCSLSGAWSRHMLVDVTPQVMAELVDHHKANCPNREMPS